MNADVGGRRCRPTLSIMAITFKLSDALTEIADLQAAAKQRSVPKQIQHWARLGKIVEENPGALPMQSRKPHDVEVK
jgi:ParD-like antitoxin of type II bacterial toxin-antitoxin system